MKESKNSALNIDAQSFQKNHYSMAELIEFCKVLKIPTTGTESQIANRIAFFLETEEISNNNKQKANKLNINVSSYFQLQRYSKENTLRYNCTFHDWLKKNSNDSQKQAVETYYNIIKNRKKIIFKDEEQSDI